MIFGVGFAGMAVEVAVIYAVQISFGALYGYIGFIVTVYMVGLSLGAAASYSKSEENNRKKFFLFFLMLIFLVQGTTGIGVSELESYYKFVKIFFLTAHIFIIAGSAGYIFGIIAFHRERVQEDAGRLGGLLNFADLIGGALAALLLPLLIIPIYGTSYAMKITALLVITTGILGALYICLKERSKVS